MKSADEIRAYRAAWRRMDRARNPDKYAEVKRRHYVKNRGRILAAVKAYQEDNRESICGRKAAKYRSHDPVERRRTRLLDRYGITLEAYDLMYADQSGCCAICGTKHPVLDVDHCHQSGRVRGLLCQHCNKGIGMFKECPEALERAISYLKASADG